MRVDILSLFPAISDVMLGESMMKRAQEAGLVTIASHNIRDWTTDKHRTTDDMPYGGGQGMVLKAEPIFAAVEQLRTPEARVVFMYPSGRRFTQEIAQSYATCPHVIVLCGHYEGVDQRVLDHLVTDEISIGDYILTNGAIAAVVFVDAIVRLIPGVLGHNESATDESFVTGQLEGPHYTRPAEFRGWKVPEILLSGNHAKIAAWRREQGRLKTERVRPDLLGGGSR